MVFKPKWTKWRHKFLNDVTSYIKRVNYKEIFNDYINSNTRKLCDKNKLGQTPAYVEEDEESLW